MDGLLKSNVDNLEIPLAQGSTVWKSARPVARP